MLKRQNSRRKYGLAKNTRKKSEARLERVHIFLPWNQVLYYWRKNQSITRVNKLKLGCRPDGICPHQVRFGSVDAVLSA